MNEHISTIGPGGDFTSAQAWEDSIPDADVEPHAIIGDAEE